jgi:hypothetical protein
VVLGVLIALGAGACGGADEGDRTGTTTPIGGDPVPSGESTNASGGGDGPTLPEPTPTDPEPTLPEPQPAPPPPPETNAEEDDELIAP